MLHVYHPSTTLLSHIHNIKFCTKKKKNIIIKSQTFSSFKRFCWLLSIRDFAGYYQLEILLVTLNQRFCQLLSPESFWWWSFQLSSNPICPSCYQSSQAKIRVTCRRRCSFFNVDIHVFVFHSQPSHSWEKLLVSLACVKVVRQKINIKLGSNAKSKACTCVLTLHTQIPCTWSDTSCMIYKCIHGVMLHIVCTRPRKYKSLSTVHMV